MLNDPIYIKVFNDADNIPNEQILLMFQIYFQLTHPEKNQEFLIKNDDLKFWKLTLKYFKEDNNGKIGTAIENDLKNIDTSVENVFKIERLLGKYVSKLTPNYYTKICGTSGLMVFIIKDIMEWVGIIYDKKANPPKVYDLCVYSCSYYTKNLNYLNENYK